MKIRTLSTVDAVIDEIGSLRLQEITGKRSANLTNWRERGRFPPTTFKVMEAELKRLHCRARGSLWSQIEVVKSRAA